jgi:hypothetical protein
MPQAAVSMFMQGLEVLVPAGCVLACTAVSEKCF